MSEELTRGGLLERDRLLGSRMRHGYRDVVAVGIEHGLTEQQVRQMANEGFLTATDEQRKAIAGKIAGNVNWEGIAAFLQAVAPIIIQMMAACGA